MEPTEVPAGFWEECLQNARIPSTADGLSIPSSSPGSLVLLSTPHPNTHTGVKTAWGGKELGEVWPNGLNPRAGGEVSFCLPRGP